MDRISDEEVSRILETYGIKDKSRKRENSKSLLPEDCDLSKLKRVEQKNEIFDGVFRTKIKNKDFFRYVDYHKISNITKEILELYQRGYRIEGTEVLNNMHNGEKIVRYVRLKN